MRERPARVPLARRVVQAQVRGDALPARALVAGAEHPVATGVQGLGVARGEDQRVGPGEAVLQLARGDAAGGLGPHVHQPDLPRAVVVALQRAGASGAGAHRAAVDDVGVGGVDGDEAALARARVGAVAQRDGAPLGGRGHADGGVVLLRAVHPVGVLVVHVQAVELRGQLVVDGRPGLPAVERHAGAAVVALDHALRVLRVDPQVVVVAVRGGHFAEAHPAVGGLPHLQVGDVDRVGVAGVGEHMGVVPGPVHQVPVSAHLRPMLAVVVAAVQTGGLTLGLHQGPHAPGAGGRGADAVLAQQALRTPRQAAAAGELLPGVAPVGGAPQPAARAAAVQVPEAAPRRPAAGVQDARVERVHGQVHGAGVGAAVQHLLPGLSAVARAVHAALGVGAEGVAQGSHVDQVRVLRVHADAADVPRLLQAQVLPGAPGVGGAVHPVAVGHVDADGGLARAGVDHVRV